MTRRRQTIVLALKKGEQSIDNKKLYCERWPAALPGTNPDILRRRKIEEGRGGGGLGRHGRERRLAKFRQNVARFRLYRLRFLQENMRFAAFFKIYQILKLTFLKFDKFCKFEILRHLQLFLLKFHENCCSFKPIFCENFEIAAVQKDANLVELKKCCRTHVF